MRGFPSVAGPEVLGMDDRKPNRFGLTHKPLPFGYGTQDETRKENPVNMQDDNGLQQVPLEPRGHRGAVPHRQRENFMDTHRTYLSTSRGLWRVMDQGMAVCADTPDRERAEACAKQLRLTPTAIWNGDAGRYEAYQPEWTNPMKTTRAKQAGASRRMFNPAKPFWF